MKPNGVSGRMKPWLEAAIALYLQKGIPVNQTHLVLLRDILAESMTRVQHMEINEYSWKRTRWLRERLREAATINDPFLSELAEDDGDIRSAIQANDWISYSTLPQIAWNWIERVTQLTKEEWESVPEIAAQIVCKEYTCDECGKHGDLNSIAELKDYMFGDEALKFTCRGCGAEMVLDIDEAVLKPASNQPRSANIVCLALGIMFIVLLLWLKLNH